MALACCQALWALVLTRYRKLCPGGLRLFGLACLRDVTLTWLMLTTIEHHLVAHRLPLTYAWLVILNHLFLSSSTLCLFLCRWFALTSGTAAGGAAPTDNRLTSCLRCHCVAFQLVWLTDAPSLAALGCLALLAADAFAPWQRWSAVYRFDHVCLPRGAVQQANGELVAASWVVRLDHRRHRIVDNNAFFMHTADVEAWAAARNAQLAPNFVHRRVLHFDNISRLQDAFPWFPLGGYFHSEGG